MYFIVNKRLATITFLYAFIFSSAEAFPTWMGVYGAFSRHSGSNPGTFTVLLNDDDPGLAAEVGIKVDGGSWTMHPMVRTGFISINSIWSFSPTVAFPPGSIIEYFFHGYDASGGNIWDSNNGQNYSLTIPAPVAVQWLGNVSQWPNDGEVNPRDDVWINAESWPIGGGVQAVVVYTTNRWTTMRAVGMTKAGVRGQSDWWHINLGKHFGGLEIEYAVMVEDALGKILWAHDNGRNFSTAINPGRSTWWVGNQSQWPPNGSITENDDFWLNVESWPIGSAMYARALYSVNGGVWYLDPMNHAGRAGNNDWWHLNLQKYPPGSTIYYTTEVTDENGAVITSSSGHGSGFVNSSKIDSDADGLPDDWEYYWWASLNAKGSDNWDNDGTAGIRMDNELEYVLGTEPIHSNDVALIALLWKPARPTEYGTLNLSYNPLVNNILSGNSVFAKVTSNPGGITTEHGPLIRDGVSGRYETGLSVSANITNMIVSFRENEIIDDNNGVGWNIPVRAFTINDMPDSDGDYDDDGIYDDEEIEHGSNPLDASSRPAGALVVVSGPTPSSVIQDAVDLVPDGGWVLLAPGVYEITAPIDFRGKKFTVRGIGDPNDVVIRPINPNRVFVFQSGEGRESRLERLTIIRAQSADPGGAILCDHSSPTFSQVIFVKCSSLKNGGAVYANGGAPLIEYSSFSNCVSYTAGGALATSASKGLTIRACMFSRNRAHGIYASGAALKFETSKFDVSSSYFTENATDNAGGAISAHASTGTMTRCTLTQNYAKYNRGSCVSAAGGNIAVADSIFWNNAGLEFSGSNISISNSIVQFFAAGVGNLNIDPLLVMDSFRLLGDSPCITRGKISMLDIDGEVVSGVPDIGCDEFVDEDGDYLADIWEQEFTEGGNAPAASDNDNDELTALAEYEKGTLPEKADTDSDGIPDGWEVSHGLNPRDADDALDDMNGWPALYRYHHETELAAPPGSEISTLSISPQGETIQELINAAPNLGVIELPPGVYEGPGNSDLLLTGKNLSIITTEGGECVIDCKGKGRGITFGNGVDHQTLLRGITIRNGNVFSGDGEGGAIRCVNASPIIESCTIVSNRSEIGAGGIYLENSDAVIRDCAIKKNIAEYNWGGGIVTRGGFARIENSRIIGNSVPSSGHYGGGGIFTDGGNIKIQNSIVAENAAERNGGGIYIGYGTFADIVNCTIASNRPQGIFESGDAAIRNSVVWGNVFDHINSIPSDLTPALFSLVGGEQNLARGVIDADPLLRSNYMLTALSLCIDAGTTVDAPEQDIHSEFRWDHPDHPDAVSSTDIGADEFVDLDLDGLDNITEYEIGSNPIAADTDNDGLSDSEEYFTHGTDPLSKDSDGDGFTDGEETDEGMNPNEGSDGAAALEASRRTLVGFWRTFFGEIPIFHYEAGSAEDLAELDGYLKQLSDKMKREVYP